MERKNHIIKVTMFIPMDFPADWDDEMIKFHLNESSWCCSNYIDILSKYDKEHGCICDLCESEVASEPEIKDHNAKI